MLLVALLAVFSSLFEGHWCGSPKRSQALADFWCVCEGHTHSGAAGIGLLRTIFWFPILLELCVWEG